MLETKKQQWYDKGIIWLLYSLGVGVPLFFSTAFYSNFAEPKLLFLRIVTVAVLLLWAWKSYSEEKIFYRTGKLNWAFIIYGAALILTTLTSSNIFSSLYGTETRFLGVFTQLNFLVIAWLVYNFITTKKELKTFITITCFTGIVLLMVYGFLQYFGAFQDSFSWSQSPQDRVFGTFGHSDHFGAYMGMCLLLSFGVVPFMKNKILQRVLILCAHLSFIVILLTGSRAALVATLLSLIIVAVILVMRSKNLRTFLKKSWIAFVVGLAVLAGIIFMYREPLAKLPVIQRLQQSVSSAREGYTPDRLSWWYSSFEMFKDRPFLGFGVSTFRDIYNKYRRQDYLVAGPGDIQYKISPESSHNDYIDILVTEGLVGFFAFLWILTVVFSAVDQKLFQKNQPDELFFITLGTKGALMVYLIQVLVNFGVVDTLTVFFLLLGAAVSAASPQGKNAEYKLVRPLKEAVICILLVGLIWGGFATYKEAYAEYAYKNALISDSLGKVDDAKNWFEEMIKFQNYRYEYYQAYADFAFKTATQSSVDPEYAKQYFQLAVQNYQNASVLNNFHPSTFYNMGIASIQLANMEQNDAYMQQGLNDLQQAIILSPNNPLFAYESAKVFAEAGKKDLAVQALNAVVRVSPQYMDAQKRLDELQKKN